MPASSSRRTPPRAPGRAAGQPGRSRPDAPPRRARASARASRRGSGLTTRAAVLALVVCALALSLAYPLREYLGQRSEIAALRERTAQQEQRVAQLEADKARWQDPAYLRTQAEERLHRVPPGESHFVVKEPDRSTARQDTEEAAPRADERGERPWFGTLWESVEAADSGR
ncbi:FtsB family cell division protein [Motilibacter aurantiacus]|uniref:FtsB family cell division protein n=1 Tax=Motilibacter aurantiacus TaxID=2714955 RepID=UPI00140A5FBF|nr:septum formation initiator family protein [Motilibacter aurantiacus]NHC45848.1 septum formation initiator family protein [Motilibacter aurantiacus]